MDRQPHTDREALRKMLEEGVSVEEIARRFEKDPSTISYWMGRHGLVAPNRKKYASRGGIERDRLVELVARGLTIAEIASELALSKATVKHWLRRHGLRTRNATGRQALHARAGKAAGTTSLLMRCPHHGDTDYVLEGRGYYRCRRCRSDAVARRRRAVKQTLVAEAGGACAICGYSRYVGALAFHHLDPKTKRIEINAKGVALALATLRMEAQKCILLCANCHAEVEGGIVALPVRFRAADGWS